MLKDQNYLGSLYYIAAAWVHIQAYYCHPTLGSKVLVERLPGMKHYPGVDLSDKKLTKMHAHSRDDLGDADLMLYVEFDPSCAYCTFGGGRAYIGEICVNGYDWLKQSINLYGTSHALIAESMAHEIGHNLGMWHDFSKLHGGTNNYLTSTNACNGQGFMSYSNHLSQWTECSVKDFTAQYTMLKNDWCMPGNHNYFTDI